jgi:hypothetical protein
MNALSSAPDQIDFAQVATGQPVGRLKRLNLLNLAQHAVLDRVHRIHLAPKGRLKTFQTNPGTNTSHATA